MLLILTNSLDATADYLVSALQRHGIAYLRFDTDVSLRKTEMSFAKGGPRLCFGGIWYRPEDFATVWYRRPERLKAEWQDHVPEGKFTLDQWSEALEGFLCPHSEATMDEPSVV